jgi:murein L,D-transpeptidase YcbB/YkuD
MASWTGFARTAAFSATLALAPGLLIATSHKADAGIFSWLGGRNQNNRRLSRRPPNGGGLAAEGGGGIFQPAPEPRSQALSMATRLRGRKPQGNGSPTTCAWHADAVDAQHRATKAAIQHYQGIVAQGVWPTVPAYAMKPGSHGEPVQILHRRLEISGDLVGQSIPDEYDEALTQAVRKFQSRHALPPTGTIDRATIDVMNVPASVRLAQLQSNLKRLQTLAPAAANRYVTVNIPAAQVEAVEGGQVAQRHAAVVGKFERQTPELSSKIMEINFNPYWYVPRSIVYKDLVPKAREFAQRGQDMLAAYHMEAFDASGAPLDSRSINWSGDAVYGYNYRQLPWSENSLGFVKINFPNKDSVYMHDTPLKSLFGRNVRFESSGCVRVHNVEALVAWILRDTPGWSVDRVMAMKQTSEQADVRLAKPIPVYFVYISAWATPDGVVNFRPDIYNHDGAAETASAQ